MALAVVVFAVTLLVRLPNLGSLVTPDEPTWLGRSANFFEALSRQDWADTYQFSHPGVTLTWLGALGFLLADPSYASEVSRQLGPDLHPLGSKPGDEIAPVLEARGVDPLQVLNELRVVVIVASAAVMALIFSALSRLLGLWAALVASALLILDPFTTGLSRLLHLDAMAAALMFLALLQAIVYLSPGGRLRDLAYSGVVAGLACLTRISALAIVPAIGALIAVSVAVELYQSRSNRSVLAVPMRRLRDVLVWGLLLLLTCVLLWPALWVAPFATLNKVLFGSMSLAEEPHSRTIFFAGSTWNEDPGLGFYPTAWLWRTMPAVIFGLILATVVLMVPRCRRNVGLAAKWFVAGSLVLAAGYALLITLEGKKFDRYLLPSIIPLIAVSGWGWAKAGTELGWVIRRRVGINAALWATALPMAFAVALQGTAAFASSPYFLSAYNPLLGGGSAAEHVMMIGWGEGYDQIAARVTGSPLAGATIMAAPPLSLAYLYQGDVVPLADSSIRSRAANGTPGLYKELIHWARADLVAISVDSRQRGLVADWLLDQLAGIDPIETVTIQDIDYVRLYDVRDLPIPSALLSRGSPVTEWDGELLLVAVETPERGATGGTIPVVTYVAPNDENAATDKEIVLTLTDAAGAELESVSKPISRPTQSRTIWAVPAELQLPSRGTTVSLTVSIRDRRDGFALRWVPAGASTPVDTPLIVASLSLAEDGAAFNVQPRMPAAPRRAKLNGGDRGNRGDLRPEHDRATSKRGGRADYDEANPAQTREPSHHDETTPEPVNRATGGDRRQERAAGRTWD